MTRLHGYSIWKTNTPSAPKALQTQPHTHTLKHVHRIPVFSLRGASLLVKHGVTKTSLLVQHAVWQRDGHNPSLFCCSLSLTDGWQFYLATMNQHAKIFPLLQTSKAYVGIHAASLTDQRKYRWERKGQTPWHSTPQREWGKTILPLTRRNKALSAGGGGGGIPDTPPPPLPGPINSTSWPHHNNSIYYNNNPHSCQGHPRVLQWSARAGRGSPDNQLRTTKDFFSPLPEHPHLLCLARHLISRQGG